MLDGVGEFSRRRPAQMQTKTLDQTAGSGCSQEDSHGKADEPALTTGEGEIMMILPMTSLGCWQKITVAC
jgi:hypothetical protein